MGTRDIIMLLCVLEMCFVLLTMYMVIIVFVFCFAVLNLQS